jgi:Holliday junction resolvase RusA-like endonuclease
VGAPEANPFLSLPRTQITLNISGDAATKQRPRFNKATGQVHQPPANIINEGDVRAVWREAGEPRMPDDAPLGIVMKITVVRPKGHFKKNGELSTEGQKHPFPERKKPDLDNALKLVCDALNSRAYRDDVRFVRATLERDWGEWPATYIRIYTVE